MVRMLTSHSSDFNEKRYPWEVLLAPSPIASSFPLMGTRVTDLTVESGTRALRTCLSSASVPSGLFPWCGKPSKLPLTVLESQLISGEPSPLCLTPLSIVNLVFWSLLHRAPRSFSEFILGWNEDKRGYSRGLPEPQKEPHGAHRVSPVVSPESEPVIVPPAL